MLKKSVIVAAFALLLSPGAARADWLFTPNLGATFDGGFTYGASIAWMGDGMLGLEGDFAFSPGLFETDDFLITEFTDSGAQAAIANLIVGIPFGGTQGAGVKPYGTVGIGWMQAELTDDLDLFQVDNDMFAWSAGGGVMGFFSDSVGLRGDVRYYRGIGDSLGEELLDLSGVDVGDVSFWRATGGVTFRW